MQFRRELQNDRNQHIQVANFHKPHNKNRQDRFESIKKMPLKKQAHNNYPEKKLTLTRLLKNSIKASGEFRSFKMPVWPSLLLEFYML